MVTNTGTFPCEAPIPCFAIATCVPGQEQYVHGAVRHCLHACAGRHFARQIAAYDVQTRRCDVYGQDAGYSERVMLIYDGLHYDALAIAGGRLPAPLNQEDKHSGQPLASAPRWGTSIWLALVPYPGAMQ